MFIAGAIHHYSGAIHGRAIQRRFERDSHLHPIGKSGLAAELDAALVNGNRFGREVRLA